MEQVGGLPGLCLGEVEWGAPCGQVEKWEGGRTCGFGLWGAFRLDINMDGRPRVGPCHSFSGGGGEAVPLWAGGPGGFAIYAG